jgi:hypothetical protein
MGSPKRKHKGTGTSAPESHATYLDDSYSTTPTLCDLHITTVEERNQRSSKTQQ